MRKRRKWVGLRLVVGLWVRALRAGRNRFDPEKVHDSLTVLLGESLPLQLLWSRLLPGRQNGGQCHTGEEGKRPCHGAAGHRWMICLSRTLSTSKESKKTPFTGR